MSDQQSSGNGHDEAVMEKGGRVWTAEPTGEVSHADREQELRNAFAGFGREQDDAAVAGHTAEHARPHHHEADNVHADAHAHAVETAGTSAGNGHSAPDQSMVVAPTAVPAPALTTPITGGTSVAADARGVLDGVAQNLRTLAGHDKLDGVPVAMFPRGIDLLEVRMHISRDRDIDLNLRVTGSTPPSPSN
jgi:hypothetical protein